MLILKRLTIWLLETIFEILALALAMVVMFGYGQQGFRRSFGLAIGTLMLLSFTTGYLLTTAVARGIWRNRKLWSYSVVATVLFLIHSLFLLRALGANQKDPDTLSVELAGCCVAFTCTLIGSFVLRQWVPSHNQLI